MKKFEIDHFVKDKLAHLQPEFDEQAWDDLEKKLDKEDHSQRAFIWWWQLDKIAAVFVVGLFGYLVYYLYTNNSVDNHIPLYAENSINFLKKAEKKTDVSPRQKEQKNDSYVYQEPKKIIKPFVEKKLIVPVSQKEEQTIAINFDRRFQDKYFHNDFSKDLKPAKAFVIDSSFVANQVSKKNKRKRQSFGVALSPVISPNGLQAGLGYTHEVALSKNVSVLSGINYTPWSSNMPVNAINTLSSPSSINPDVKVKLNTIEIPLEAKVKVAKNVAVSGGVSNTLLIKETIGNVVNNNPELSISSINLGVSYDIKISKNSQINLQPYYRIPVQSIGLSGTQLSGFGLRTGFSYNTR
ncbi:hypothetical protein AD998_10820 [bacterium 336/3]|nr:hypothetical protein AD998_10820 [bacterium 336/3]